MTDNLRIWTQVDKTDPAHTKKVNQRGGFTAISAAYQIKRATEVFGPVGEGWGYDAGEPIFQAGLVFVPVTLWHGERGHVFGPMFGGAEWESKGRFDTDALKKATTDALTKLLSQLGFNADVFLGRFDDNKYVAEMRSEFSEEPKKRDTGPAPVDGKDFWKCEGQGLTAHAAKKEGLETVHEAMRDEIVTLHTAEEWKAWCAASQPIISRMPLSWRMLLREEAEERGRFLGAIND